MNTQNNEYDIPLNHTTVDKNKPAEQSGGNDESLDYNAAYGLAKDPPFQVSDDRLYSELNAPKIEHDIPGKTLPEGAEMKSERGFIEKLMMKKFACFLLIVIMTVIIATSVCLSIAFVKISELRSDIAAEQSDMIENPTNPSPSVTTTQKPNDGLGSFDNPAASCAALVPFPPSGYYWIRSSNGSAVRVYCDMTRSCGGVTGGWMRVAELDMTNSSSQCPSGLTERADSNIRTCGIASSSANCSSINLPTTGFTYSKICGRILAYQYGNTDAFFGENSNRSSNASIDTFYVDGVSLTHGSPRQHIWTFAAANDEVGSFPPSNCICTNITLANEATPSPPYVGNDYFCDTGSRQTSAPGIFFPEILWDGAGCGPLSTCCIFNNPPWFYKELPAPITDNIEMRVCSDEDRNNEDVAIEAYEIFVQL